VVDQDRRARQLNHGFGAIVRQRAQALSLAASENQGRLWDGPVNHQDFVAWITQGKNADRSLEKLGESDRGVILYRKLLRDQMNIVSDGGDPMNTFRDPDAASYVELPLERWPTMQGSERFTTYMMAQAEEPPTQVVKIQKVLDSWAEQAKA